MTRHVTQPLRSLGSMRVLILGGTGFLGYHTTLTALGQGHEVWLFNRGVTRSEAFPEVPRLIGDRRAGDLDALDDAPAFDAVIDCTGYLPSEVRDAATRLGDRTGRYLFVSSVSVYAFPVPAGADEDAPLASLPQGLDATEVTGATYGPLKAACEQTLAETLGDRATIVRPGLIAGPEDPTDRFTYWVRRGLEGGRLLAPGSPTRLVQLVDARDVATFMLTLATEDASGTFNVVGEPIPFAELLEMTTETGEFVWVDDERLREAGLAPWSDLPLWIPAPDGETALTISNARAKAAGLQLIPLEQTIQDVAAWDLVRQQPPLKAGISRERQDELVERFG